MKYHVILSCALLAQGCTGDDTAAGPGSQDASLHDALAIGTQDSATAMDSAAAPDSTAPAEGGGPDAAQADADAGASSVDASCPAAWLGAPRVDPSIAVPDGGVILHAAANGSQDYACMHTTTDAGAAYAWTFVGPEADLTDCNGALIGHHMASDGGPTLPEWIQTSDGTYVIGRKVGSGFTPDGGAGSIPWLLLQAVAHGGSGTLSQAQYIQRVKTDGGISPSGGTCDQSSAGTAQKVPYTADYFFFGP
jgi:Protein of unknown function (DUF3455)